MIKLKKLLIESETSCAPFIGLQHLKHWMNWMWTTQKLTAGQIGLPPASEVTSCDDIAKYGLAKHYLTQKAMYVNDADGYADYKKKGGKKGGSEEKTQEDQESTSTSGSTVFDILGFMEKNPWITAGLVVSSIAGGIVLLKMVKPYVLKGVKGMAGGSVGLIIDGWKVAGNKELGWTAVREMRAAKKTLKQYSDDLVAANKSGTLEKAKSIQDPAQRKKVIDALNKIDDEVLSAQIMDALIVDMTLSPALKADDILPFLSETQAKLYGKTIQEYKAKQQAIQRKMKQMGPKSRGKSVDK